MDTDPTKFEGASRPTKGSEDPQGEFAEHRRREELFGTAFRACGGRHLCGEARWTDYRCESGRLAQ